MFICCLKSRSKIFRSCEDGNIAGEGLQDLGISSAATGFEKGRDFYNATPGMK